MLPLANTEIITHNILVTDSITREVILKTTFNATVPYEEIMETAHAYKAAQRPTWRGNPTLVQVTTQRNITTEEVTNTL